MSISEIGNFVERKHRIKNSGETWTREPFTPTNYKKVPLTDRDYIFSPVNLWNMHHTQITIDRFQILFTYTDALKEDLERWESCKRKNARICKDRRKKYYEWKKQQKINQRILAQNKKPKVIKSKKSAPLIITPVNPAIKLKDIIMNIPRHNGDRLIYQKVLAVLCRFKSPISKEDIVNRARIHKYQFRNAIAKIKRLGFVVNKLDHPHIKDGVYKLEDINTKIYKKDLPRLQGGKPPGKKKPKIIQPLDTRIKKNVLNILTHSVTPTSLKFICENQKISPADCWKCIGELLCDYQIKSRGKGNRVTFELL